MQPIDFSKYKTSKKYFYLLLKNIQYQFLGLKNKSKIFIIFNINKANITFYFFSPLFHWFYYIVKLIIFQVKILKLTE